MVGNSFVVAAADVWLGGYEVWWWCRCWLFVLWKRLAKAFYDEVGEG